MIPMVRLFVAVEIENQEVLSRVINIKRRIESCSSETALKVVEDENLHITLRFIGEVDEALVDDIVKALECASTHKKFTARLRGVGAFPSVSRPRVIWIGISEGATQLKLLRDCLERGLRRLGLPPEREDFTPHLTLARVKDFRPSKCLSELFAEASDIDAGTTHVTRVKLKKSTLTPRGPIYSDLFEVTLAD